MCFGEFMLRWLGNIILALFTLVVCLVMVEVGFRIWLSGQAKKLASGLPNPVQAERPEFYYAPGGSGPVHDFPRMPEKGPGVFRVVVIGDSFTYPTFMQFDDAFPKRLERMLNLQNGPMKAEVLNFGKRGLSTEQEVNTLKQILSYKPDLVILQITLNDTSNMDFGTAVKQQPGRYVYGNLQITPETHPILAAWKSAGFIAQRWHASKTLPSMIQYYHDIYDQTNWNHFSNALQSFKEITTKENVKFGAVLFPLFYTPIDERYPFLDLHQKIDAELEKNAISYLDLKERFRGLNPERLQVKPGEDTHPNEIAHRIAAEAIYQWLEKGAFIPEPLRIQRTADREEGKSRR